MLAQVDCVARCRLGCSCFVDELQVVELYNLLEFGKINGIEFPFLEVVGTEFGKRLDIFEGIVKNVVQLVCHGLRNVLDVVLVARHDGIFVFELER